MADVFISYKREERARCERIAAKLRGLGLDVWFDANLESGESFDREIERTIGKAKAVLVLWSQKSVESRWVRNEATTAKQDNKLVAAALEPSKPPLAFIDVHYEDLHKPDFQDDDPAWLKLVERIGKLTGRPQIVSYSQALARAAVPLEQWAAQHPDDPLAHRMRAKADLLGGTTQVIQPPAPPPKRSLGMVISASVLCLGIGSVAGFAGAGALRPSGEVTITSLPEATPQSVAATLIGRYRPADQAACNGSEREVDILLGRNSIQIAAGAVTTMEQLTKLEDGWLVTTGSDGVEYSYRREGSRLLLRAGAQELPMESCE